MWRHLWEKELTVKSRKNGDSENSKSTELRDEGGIGSTVLTYPMTCNSLVPFAST